MSTKRGYSWPPFTAGHELSMKHGAHSERKLRPLVDELLEAVHGLAPWCSSPVFAPTVEAWAWAEARAITYRRHFDEVGMSLDAEDPPRGLDQWDRAERRAASLRAELGLSPSSLTKLLSGLSAIDGPAAQSGLEALRTASAAIRAASAPPQPAGQLEEGGGDEVPEDLVGERGEGVHVVQGDLSSHHSFGADGPLLTGPSDR